MTDKKFVDRIKDGDIKEIDETIIKKELEKNAQAMLGIEKGDSSYFLQGLCGIDLQNVGVERTRCKSTG